MYPFVCGHACEPPKLHVISAETDLTVLVTRGRTLFPNQYEDDLDTYSAASPHARKAEELCSGAVRARTYTRQAGRVDRDHNTAPLLHFLSRLVRARRRITGGVRTRTCPSVAPGGGGVYWCARVRHISVSPTAELLALYPTRAGLFLLLHACPPKWDRFLARGKSIRARSHETTPRVLVPRGVWGAISWTWNLIWGDVLTAVPPQDVNETRSPFLMSLGEFLSP
jgi:hypothetical protein